MKGLTTPFLSLQSRKHCVLDSSFVELSVLFLPADSFIWTKDPARGIRRTTGRYLNDPISYLYHYLCSYIILSAIHGIVLNDRIKHSSLREIFPWIFIFAIENSRKIWIREFKENNLQKNPIPTNPEESTQDFFQGPLHQYTTWCHPAKDVNH